MLYCLLESMPEMNRPHAWNVGCRAISTNRNPGYGDGDIWGEMTQHLLYLGRLDKKRFGEPCILEP